MEVYTRHTVPDDRALISLRSIIDVLEVVELSEAVHHELARAIVDLLILEEDHLDEPDYQDITRIEEYV